MADIINDNKAVATQSITSDLILCIRYAAMQYVMLQLVCKKPTSIFYSLDRKKTRVFFSRSQSFILNRVDPSPKSHFKGGGASYCESVSAFGFGCYFLLFSHDIINTDQTL